jgi:hypothetical protein
MRTPGLT